MASSWSLGGTQAQEWVSKQRQAVGTVGARSQVGLTPRLLCGLPRTHLRGYLPAAWAESQDARSPGTGPVTREGGGGESRQGKGQATLGQEQKRRNVPGKKVGAPTPLMPICRLHAVTVRSPPER